MLNFFQRADYAIRQGARVAWYTGHYIGSRRSQIRAARKSGVKPPSGPLPPMRALMSDMGALFARDLSNADRGIYPVPFDDDGSLLGRLEMSRRFFRDLPLVEARRQAGDGHEVAHETGASGLPRYYRQNFHYQTDGYLSDHSAGLYDMQVEVLFTGAGNAMRRQVLVPLGDFIKGRDQRTISALDVACGTGRFLRFFRHAYPRIGLAGVDLSHAYLAEGGRHLRHLKPVRLVCANAERLPWPDASLDLVTAIFLFHELPPEIRKSVAGEIGRVLRPGGRFIFLDSLQTGDKADYDGLLELFDSGFHEPYFSTYLKQDFVKLFDQAGLARVDTTRAFLSRMDVYERP